MGCSRLPGRGRIGALHSNGTDCPFNCLDGLWFPCNQGNPNIWTPVRAGTPYARLWCPLADALANICVYPAIASHFELLRQDTELCTSLLRLLSPGICAMAAGLQLPLERRRSECSWHTAACMAVWLPATSPLFSKVLAGDPGMTLLCQPRHQRHCRSSCWLCCLGLMKR